MCWIVKFCIHPDVPLFYCSVSLCAVVDRMKILNERNLAAFGAAPSTPADKQGWLFKRGETNRAYQRRWFSLKGNLLFYFEKPNEREPIGVVILEGCTIECSDGDPYSFEVAFHGPGTRTYYLCAESQRSMEDWMKALSCASYDYMKMMVTELQRQVDELEGGERSRDSMGVPPGFFHAHPNGSVALPVAQESKINSANSSQVSGRTLFSKLSLRTLSRDGPGKVLPMHLRLPFGQMHEFFKCSLMQSPIFPPNFESETNNNSKIAHRLDEKRNELISL
ncbi:unnamed protein product [Notodromas monacha]|uniref:PH domain-containing protein n=1 Tax=Notodromas monacha TaxID=399045 RepID=A0A7R9BFU7_9CRUS|nr:unnamed protein product [Notodromas monacha]CAG0913853.1 unnamed protein product [Notodromas monacha]